MTFFAARPIHLADKAIIAQILKCNFNINPRRIVSIVPTAFSEKELRKRRYWVHVRNEFDGRKLYMFSVDARKMKGEYGQEVPLGRLQNGMDFAVYVLKTS